MTTDLMIFWVVSNVHERKMYVYPPLELPRPLSHKRGHISNVTILMKNHDKKDMNHNMTGEHSNGRRNLNHTPNDKAAQHNKEIHMHHTPHMNGNK